jgi:hypothetical protein
VLSLSTCVFRNLTVLVSDDDLGGRQSKLAFTTMTEQKQSKKTNKKQQNNKIQNKAIKHNKTTKH